MISRGRDIRAEVRQQLEDRRRVYSRERIRESKYCSQYKDVIVGSKITRYIMHHKILRAEKVKLARWRLGNEVRAAAFWRRDEEKVCRSCGIDWKQ